MNRDNEYTRLLGEVHRILDNSVPRKDYDILANCLRSCRNAIDDALQVMEAPYSKRSSERTAKTLRIFLDVLEGHLHDPWVNSAPISKRTKFEDYVDNSLIKDHWKKAK